MSHDSALRRQARQAIQAGRLPNRPPDRTWGGPGTGVDCAVCGALLKLDEVEFEIEFGRDGDDPAFSKHHIHVHCLAAWESERQKLEPEKLERATGASSSRHTPSAARPPMAGAVSPHD